MSEFSYKIHSLEDLEIFVDTIAKFIQPGSVIAMEGDLGAGKTTFTQMFAKYQGIEGIVKSPTYTIMHHYPMNKDSQLIHLDLYRLKNPEELETVGLQELIDEQKHIIVIEWPEIAKGILPAGTLWLTFTILGENTRKIAITEL